MILLLQFSIAVIALFVTYASVYGLGALFSTIAVPVMFAGTALEAGKYVAVSYAYQYWERLRRLEAILLTFFVVLMMVFTSAGVFAYLGQGYQSSFNELEQKELRLGQMEAQRKATAERIAAIDAQIANLPSNVVTGRIKLIREYENEKAPLVKQLSALDTDVLALKNDLGNTQIHVGPITYMAKAFNTTVPVAATWVIMALTICLDPFALFLSILLNKLMAIRREEAATAHKLMRPPVPPEPAPVVKPTVDSIKPSPLPVIEPIPEALDTSSPRWHNADTGVYGEEYMGQPAPTPVVEPVAVQTVSEPEPAQQPVVEPVVIAAPPAPAAPTLAVPAEEVPLTLLDSRPVHQVRAEINETAGTVIVQKGGQPSIR